MDEIMRRLMGGDNESEEKEEENTEGIYNCLICIVLIKGRL